MGPTTKIQQLREAKGWSRETLARKAGVTLMTVYRLERKENVPGLRVANGIAQALGVTVDEAFPSPEAVA